MDKDRIEGAATNVGGKIKEGVGKLIGDTRMETEGKVDQLKGKVQNSIGGAQDAIRDAEDRTVDRR